MTLLDKPRLNQKKDGRTVGKGIQPIFLIFFTLIGSLSIEGRLAYLQVVDGHKYKVF